MTKQKLAAYIPEKWEPRQGLALDAPIGLVRAVGDVADRVLEFIGSTEDVDRYQEVLTVAGWSLVNYRANPVFLFGHDYKQPAIGKALKVWKDLDSETRRLMFQIKFASRDEYEFADTIYKLFTGGYMQATSVGFLPMEWTDTQEEAKADPRLPWRTYKRQDLLELSAVPVPANPFALQNALARGVIQEPDFNRLRALGVPVEREVIDLSQYRTAPAPAEAPTCVRCGAKTGSLQDRNDEGLCVDCEKDLEILRELFEAEMKGAIPYSAHGKVAAAYPEGDSWDAPRARVELRKWASKDGSGDPATLDWPKFRKGFAWFDSGNAQTLGAYLLPHHRIKGGELASHWKGTVASMTVLLGARGGVNIPDNDRAKVYAHLAAEYKVFEKEPPEFKAYVDLKDILTGAKDLETACALYREVNGMTDAMPVKLVEKFSPPAEPSVELANGTEVVPAEPAAGVEPKGKLIVKRIVVDPIGHSGVILVLATESFFKRLGADQNLEVVFENGEDVEAAALDVARSLVKQRAFESLPVERKEAILAATPGGERVDLSQHGDLLALVLEKLLGEPIEARAGAVLNKRNLARVKQIVTLAQEVLAEAEPPQDQPVESTEPAKATETSEPPKQDEASAPESVAAAQAPALPNAAPAESASAPAAPSAVPEDCPGEDAHQAPPELEIVEVLEERETSEQPVTSAPEAPAPTMAEAKEVEGVEIEILLDGPEAPAPAQPPPPQAPPSPSGQGDVAIELDPAAFAETVESAIRSALGSLTGDVRSIRRGR